MIGHIASASADVLRLDSPLHASVTYGGKVPPVLQIISPPNGNAEGAFFCSRDAHRELVRHSNRKSLIVSEIFSLKGRG